jgi:hypothetical protein
MLPFEDRFSRQRRLPEVGPRGQERLQANEWKLARHTGLSVEQEYLVRAGAEHVSVDNAVAPLPFPFGEVFTHPAPEALARGAWSALARIRAVLEQAAHSDHQQDQKP